MTLVRSFLNLSGGALDLSEVENSPAPFPTCEFAQFEWFLPICEFVEVELSLPRANLLS